MVPAIAPVHAIDLSAPRTKDLLQLMGVSLLPAGIAAYCNKKVEPNQKLLEAAERWNARHLSVMENIVRALEEDGGLSENQKRVFDVRAYKTVEAMVESESDKGAFCSDIAGLMDRGMLDLERQPDTASAMSRIMGKH
jgi:hypothetical protein